MKETKYLFDPIIGDDVILNYSLDALKVIVEEKDWSSSIVMGLDANDFNLNDFRTLIWGIQEYYYQFNVIPDYDVLFGYLFDKNFKGGKQLEISDIDKELYIAYINKCKEKELSADRVKQIETSLPLFSRYLLIARIANYAVDGHRDGYTSDLSFFKKEDRIIELAEKLKMLKNNPTITPTTTENWV